jgi:hypothetical protein
MYFYSAFNLKIKSDILLPAFIEYEEFSSLHTDITIRLGKIRDSFVDHQNTGFYFHLSVNEAYFSWKDIGKYLAINGDSIIVEPSDHAEESAIRLPLIGVVLGALLHQRGLFVLHGSSVAKDGEAIVFLAHKGVGKSTIASKLYTRGFDFISDDHVVIRNNNGKFLIVPSFPQIKLWSDSVVIALGKKPDELPRLLPDYEKYAYHVKDRFITNSVNLKKIFILQRDNDIRISIINQQVAFVELIRYQYLSRFGPEFIRGREATVFHFSADLVKTIPIFQLRVPSSLSNIETIENVIIHQMYSTEFDAAAS